MNIISSYTTAQAIEDGTFVDMTPHPLCKEHGFKWPVTLTSGVYAVVNVEEDSVLAQEGQSLDGRFHDLLTMAKMEVSRMVREEDHFGAFECIMRVKTGPYVDAKTMKFFIAVNDMGTGPCFTIMLPEEY